MADGQYFLITSLYYSNIEQQSMLTNLDKNASLGPENADLQPQCKKIQDYIYRFSDQIGMGNFSKVFKGIHQTTNKQVAIKIIQLSSLTNSRLQQLLNTQTKILKMISHPNVIGCQQILSSIRNCYIITELCNGGDLEKKLKKAGHFKQKQIYPIVANIYEGLKYLAKKNIVHRDIKVSNIFINNGTYKIADFGFAQVSQVEFKDISVGSPIYMSPEGYINNMYGPKTDVWAFGVLLYQLVEGKTPYYDCRTQAELKQKLLKQIDSSNFSSQISSQLKNLIIQCLQINPTLRIRTLDIENTAWMKRVLKHVNQNNKIVQKQNIEKLNPNAHNHRKTTDQLILKTEGNSHKPHPSQTSPNNLHQILSKNYLQKYNNFFKAEQKEKVRSDEEKDSDHRRKHSTLDKTIRASKDESIQNKNNESGKIFYSPKNAIYKFEKNIGFKSVSPNTKFESFNFKNITTPENTHNIMNISSKLNTHNKNQSLKITPVQQNNIAKLKSMWIEKAPTKQNTRQILANIGQNKAQKCNNKQKYFVLNTTSNNSYFQGKESKEDSRELKNSDRIALAAQYKNYLTGNSNTSSYQKHDKNNIKIHDQSSKQAEKQRLDFFDHKTSKTPHSNKPSEKEDFFDNIQNYKSGKISVNLKSQKKMDKKPTGLQQSPKIILRSLKFGDCIGLIHYCRLCYKLACLLDQSGEPDQTKQFLTSWSVQLLLQLSQKMQSGEIILTNDTCLINNPSINPSGQVQKKKKLQDVIQQYLQKYSNPLKNSDKQQVVVKQASSTIYNLYLVKSHEFRQRTKDKKSYLYFALICYLSILDRETRNLMEFSYQLKKQFDGKNIEKLLNIKISEFNRKIVEDIVSNSGDGSAGNEQL